MQICECQSPRPKPAANAPGHKVCETCGQWWMPAHGSLPQPQSIITGDDWKRELAIARATPNAAVQFITEKSNQVLAQAKSIRIRFGVVHRGESLEEIAATDPLYLDWLNGQDWTGAELKAAVAVVCKHYERKIDRAMEAKR